MRYICTQDLYLDEYDADGFLIENKYAHIPKDSIWEEDTECCKFIGGKDSVHLDRVWKSKKQKQVNGLKLIKEHY